MFTLRPVRTPTCVQVLSTSHTWDMFERRYHPNKARKRPSGDTHALRDGASSLLENHEPMVPQEGVIEIVKEVREMVNGELNVRRERKKVDRKDSKRLWI